VNTGTSNQILQDKPETDSHPDVESMEDVLEQETTYFQGDEDTNDDTHIGR